MQALGCGWWAGRDQVPPGPYRWAMRVLGFHLSEMGDADGFTLIGQQDGNIPDLHFIKIHLSSLGWRMN